MVVSPAVAKVGPAQILYEGENTEATGLGFTVIVMLEVAATQGPAPSESLEVNVRDIVPELNVGVYVEVGEFTLPNVPELADQVLEVALPPIDPASVIDVPAHNSASVPVKTVGIGFMVIVTVELAATQDPTPSGSFVVRVKTTVPDDADGV